MDYLTIIVTEGAQPEEALEYMNRNWPAWAEAMERRGGRRLGRELDHPPTPATVRLRQGRPLVTDGPFAETKEYVGGISVFQARDLDDAIAAQSGNPVNRYCPFEIRPFPDGLRLGPGAEAFAKGDDSAGIPWLLSAWVHRGRHAAATDPALRGECRDWREDLLRRGRLVLGAELGGPETAATLRWRDGETRISPGPFLDIDSRLAGIDVVSCRDREEAVALAATHPVARQDAVEVRQFYTDPGLGETLDAGAEPDGSGGEPAKRPLEDA